MLFYFLLGFLGILVVVFYMERHRVFKELNFDGPTPLPLFGNLFQIQNKYGMLDNMLEYTKMCGSTYKASLGMNHYLLVGDAETVAFIMNSVKFNEKDRIYKLLKRWLCTGLLTSFGNKWLKRRKMITPTFHFKILSNFVETFESVGEILIKKLGEKADQKPFDVYNMITLYAMDVICETAMGTSVNAQTDSNSDYVQSVRELLNLLTDRGLSLFKFFDFIYVFYPAYWREVALTKKMHSTTMKIISQRRAKKMNFNENLRDEHGVKQKIAFLDMLLKSTVDGEPLTDEEIREEVDTFMFEGHDTTATAMSFGLLELSRNPKIQEKIYEELESIFGESDRAATYEDLQKMDYLEMVLKEVLRLYPPVPLFGRVTREKIVFDKGTIQPNTGIFICSYSLQRNPIYFENPNEFKPERFAPENAANITPFSYIPFSAGQRNCIGQKFAMLEMKSTFSKIIRHFELLPDPNFKMQISYEVILKSKTGMSIRIKRRGKKE